MEKDEKEERMRMMLEAAMRNRTLYVKGEKFQPSRESPLEIVNTESDTRVPSQTESVILLKDKNGLTEASIGLEKLHSGDRSLIAYLYKDGEKESWMELLTIDGNGRKIRGFTRFIGWARSWEVRPDTTYEAEVDGWLHAKGIDYNGFDFGDATIPVRVGDKYSAREGGIFIEMNG